MRELEVMVLILSNENRLSRRVYAKYSATGATAGAMLIPIVTNAQNTAANNDANWLRFESVILNSF
jgi:hypothetical protein